MTDAEFQLLILRRRDLSDKAWLCADSIRLLQQVKIETQQQFDIVDEQYRAEMDARKGTL